MGFLVFRLSSKLLVFLSNFGFPAFFRNRCWTWLFPVLSNKNITQNSTKQQEQNFRNSSRCCRRAIFPTTMWCCPQVMFAPGEWAMRSTRTLNLTAVRVSDPFLDHSWGGTTTFCVTQGLSSSARRRSGVWGTTSLSLFTFTFESEGAPW